MTTSPPTPQILLAKVLDCFASTRLDIVYEEQHARDKSGNVISPTLCSSSSSSSFSSSEELTASTETRNENDEILAKTNSNECVPTKTRNPAEDELLKHNSNHNKNKSGISSNEIDGKLGLLSSIMASNGSVSLGKDVKNSSTEMHINKEKENGTDIYDTNNYVSKSGTSASTPRRTAKFVKVGSTFDAPSVDSNGQVEVLFPSLSLMKHSDQNSLINENSKFPFPTNEIQSNNHHDIFLSPVHKPKSDENSDLAKLIRRPMTTPLLSLLSSENEESPACKLVGNEQQHSYLQESLHALFRFLVHRRLDNWMQLLDRVINLKNNNNNHGDRQKVFSALQEVEKSIVVENTLSLNFHIAPQTHDHSSEKKLEEELAKLAAAAMTSMKGLGEEKNLTSALSSNPVKKRRREGPEPATKRTTDKHDTDSTQRKISLSLVICVSGSVSAQIAPELNQQQTFSFHTSGEITGTFTVSPDGEEIIPGNVQAQDSQEFLSLVGVDFNLNTEELVECMERQARFVVRSAAESVMLNIATEGEKPSHTSEPAEKCLVKTQDSDAYTRTPTQSSTSFANSYKADKPLTSSGMMLPPPPRRSGSSYPPARVSPPLTPKLPVSQPFSARSPNSSPPTCGIPALVSPPASGGTISYDHIHYSSVPHTPTPCKSVKKGPRAKRSKGPFMPVLGEQGNKAKLTDDALALASLKHTYSPTSYPSL